MHEYDTSAYKHYNHNATRQALRKKRTWFSRSTNTIASSRQRNHEEQRQKCLFLFILSPFCRRCNTTREARKQKIWSFFFLTRTLQNTLAPSAKRDFFVVFLFQIALQSANTKRELKKQIFRVFFFSSNFAECAGQRREAQ